jgi:diguanylate cyclase (GGDEF)-like protein
VLKDFGKLLLSTLRQTDTVMRSGGDEFVMMMSDVAEPESILTVAQRVLEAARKPIMFHDHEVRITASIGISVYPQDGEEIEVLLKHADIAMYHIKVHGRDNYVRYEPGMGDG